jgi:CubicO group peptidase (beta-lactamase class C family)
MNLNIRKLLFLYFISISIYSCQKEEIVDLTQKAELERIIDSEFKLLQMPGLACLAVKDDSIVYFGSRGYENIKEEKEFSFKTRMLIGSVSKTITLTAIMQLYDNGMIDLDRDINMYLPFQVRNPSYKDEPITVRMLLTHTSSISDAYPLAALNFWGYVDFPETLMSFEQNYLTTDGKYYTKNNFSGNKPGTTYLYSNVSASLIACLVEYVSGISFNDYCKTNIFEPLGMNSTTWFYSETPKNEIAIPYANVNIINLSEPFTTSPDYPAGHLITTIEDLSKFMRAYILDGRYNNFQLLKPQTVDSILYEYKGNQGLIFVRYKMGRFVVWGHDGAVPGIAAEMHFDREKRVGYIMFTNRNLKYSRTTAIGNALLIYADQQ